MDASLENNQYRTVRSVHREVCHRDHVLYEVCRILKSVEMEGKVSGYQRLGFGGMGSSC